MGTGTGGGGNGGGNGDNGVTTIVKGPNISITNMTFSNTGGTVTLPALSKGTAYIIENGIAQMIAYPGSNNIDGATLNLDSQTIAALKVYEIDDLMQQVSGMTAIPGVKPIGAESSTPRIDLWKTRLEVAQKALVGSSRVDGLAADLSGAQTFLNLMISNSESDADIDTAMASHNLSSFGSTTKSGVDAAIQDYLDRNPTADYGDLQTALKADWNSAYSVINLWYSRSAGDFSTATGNALRDIVVDEFQDWTTSSNYGNFNGKGGTVSFLYDRKNNVLHVPGEREGVLEIT